MPLGVTMGKLLPERTTPGLMLFLVFVLGVGCTFAEPAIAALQLAGTLLDPADSPYLWLVCCCFCSPLIRPPLVKNRAIG